ncbi:hypothetical protein JOF57_001478 [Mycolicibacterium lutetiense]|jgi:hypothetical protein|uniref:Ferredoxin n=1 Tax=Mycolicibacterium lutetiense TaxID=1641992 RepID=A0ABS4ZQ33_9MYCO|nr:hypothetical protein [Mycolicibacterium lutetiense]
MVKLVQVNSYLCERICAPGAVAALDPDRAVCLRRGTDDMKLTMIAEKFGGDF